MYVNIFLKYQMFPRNYASKVPPAGIKTHGGESVKDCLTCDDEYHGPDTQTLYRHRWLGDPGQRKGSNFSFPLISGLKILFFRSITLGSCIINDK